MNTLEYSEILQTKLDEKMTEQSTTGWMEANAGQVIYDGGKYIKIPSMDLTGLKDYDRKEGYKGGGVTLGYQTMEMTMDRGTYFLLDSMDINETNFIANATTIANEFQRTKVVPEVDAYRYSKIAAITQGTQISYTVDAQTIMDALIDDIAYVRNIVGESEPLVCSVNGLVKGQLEKLKDFKGSVNVADFMHGTISTKVKTLNEVPLLSVPSDRMKTSYVFADGDTEGQTDGGFKPGTTAKQINWIIAPKRAIIAVSKQDKMKIFDPDTYQKADAWYVAYRKYHDLWIKKNMLEAIRTNVSA